MTINALPRNAPCPCGSKHKYKRCCLKKDALAATIQKASNPLEAIYFCANIPLTLDCHPVSFLAHPELRDRRTILPAGTPVRKKELLTRSHVLKTPEHLHALPGLFEREPVLSVPSKSDDPFHYSYWEDQVRRAAALARTLQYRFRDGTVLNAWEALYHPAGKDLPIPLLALSNSWVQAQKQALNQLSLLPGTQPTDFSYYRQAELAVLSVFLRLREIDLASMGVALFYTETQEITEPREALPLALFDRWSESQTPSSSAGWRLEPPESWDSKAGHLQFQTSSPWTSINFLLAPHGTGDSKDLALFFHPFALWVTEVNGVLNALVGMEPRTPPPALHDTLSPPLVRLLQTRREIEGHQRISHCLTELRHHTDRVGCPRIQTPPAIPLPTKPRLALSSGTGPLPTEARISFQIEYQEHALPLWNLPANCATACLRALSGGIENHGSVPAVSLASQGRRRDADLKLLKHSGLSGWLFLECVGFDLDRRAPDGTAIPDEKALWTRILISANRLVFPDEERSLEQRCSDSALAHLRNVVHYWCRHSASQEVPALYTPGGVLHLQGTTGATLRLFQTLVLETARQTGGDCFRRPRFQFLPHLAPDGFAEFTRGDESRAQPLDFAASPRAFVPLLRHGFEFLVDGAPVELAEAEDLTSRFTLRSRAGEPAASPDSDGASNTGGPIDWFELHPKFFFKGIELGKEALTRLAGEGLLHFGGKLYLLNPKGLPSVRRLERFWERLQGGSPGGSGSEASTEFHPLERSQVLELLALRASGTVIQSENPEWLRICAFFDSLREGREAALSLPDSIHARLLPYQRNGVQWLHDLYQLRLGGILADDMGLGKTLQTLAFLELLRSRGELGKALIIVPTSLTFNWRNEAGKFTPELPIELFQSARGKDALRDFLASHEQGVVVCTYTLFTEHLEFFQNFQWNIAVLDEAQNIKNLSAKRTTAARKLEARFKLCLTGTPLENHLGEFYSLLDWCVPGALGRYEAFRLRYIDLDATRPLDPEDIRFLKQNARPLILRRTKSEILTQLPMKQETTLKIPFEKKQEKIYRNIALSWNEQIKSSIESLGEAQSQLAMLTALLRLRQACSDPATLPTVRYPEVPPKVALLGETLQEIIESGESALVFTQFLGTLDRVARELKRAGIPHSCLHGGTPRAEREKILERFQNHAGGSVLLMTLKTGGVGLNLVKASYVFHLEPWWNPAVENQATDRAHRMGQTKPVQVYRYLIRDSVEEKIEILKDRKNATFQALFGETPDTANEDDRELISRPSSSLLTQRDFEYLLGARSG